MPGFSGAFVFDENGDRYFEHYFKHYYEVVTKYSNFWFTMIIDKFSKKKYDLGMIYYFVRYKKSHYNHEIMPNNRINITLELPLDIINEIDVSFKYKHILKKMIEKDYML